MAVHSLAVNGVTINCEDRGKGVPLVLLHGFPLDREMWAAQIEALGGEFRVIARGLRGWKPRG